LTSSMMLSLTFPPITVNNGSMPFINDTTLVPNPSVISSSSLQSTIRFYGYNDIFISSVNNTKAVFIGISSFTSAGYSTLNGQMINNPKISYSSFSTATGLLPSQSFISSVLFMNQYSTIGYPSTNVAAGGVDIFFSSIIFDANHMMKYVNMNSMLTTMSVEYYPNFQFPIMVNPGYSYQNPPLPLLPNGQTLIKQVTSYIQLTSGANTYVLPETNNIRYMNSQQAIHSTFYFSTNYFANANTVIPFGIGSNFFTDSVRMTINPYNLSTYVGNNLPQSTTLQVWHVVSSALYAGPSITNSNIGFVTPTVINNSYYQNGLFLRVSNVVTSPGY
jgi:hypothetical protein